MGFTKEQEDILKALIGEMEKTKKNMKDAKEKKKQVEVSFAGIINKILED